LVWPTTKLIAALLCASARLEYGSLSGPSPAGNITKFNIEAIAKLENEARHGRTTEGASDAIVKFNGSVAFLAMVLRAYTFLHGAFTCRSEEGKQRCWPQSFPFLRIGAL
jgi:hypothetical protein